MNDEILRKTYRFDTMRKLFQGALDSAFMTFTLLVAIRIFHAPNGMKATLVSISWAGGLLTPWITRQFSRTRLHATQAAAILFGIVALCFGGVVFATSLWSYLLLLTLASICYRAEGPLMITIYRQNYPLKNRGSLFSTGLFLSALMGIIFSYLSGKLMDFRLADYRYAMLFVALCALLGSLCFLKIPSRSLQKTPPSTPCWHYFRHLWYDRVFGQLTFFTFLAGLAYQMLIPVKIEYLANGKYDLNLSNLWVMSLSWMIPSAARLLSTPIMGYLFDHVRLITLRFLINLFILSGFLLFFNSCHLELLILSSALMGIAMAGTFLLHTLWISRIAPEEKLSAYMSVYVAVSSIRSILAPILGYGILTLTSPRFAGNVGVLLTIFAAWGFWRWRRLRDIQE